MSHKFFTIPFDKVPANLPSNCTIWYSMWTTVRPTELPLGARPPLVIGVTTEDQLPAGATTLEGGDKDPLPPPPPPLAAASPDYLRTYKRAFKGWLSRSGDK